MKKRLALICISILILSCLSCAQALEEDWTVSEDLEYTPDTRYQARVLMRKMTLDDKIMQLFIVAPEALTGEKYTVRIRNAKELLEASPVGGIVLYGQNIVSEDQLRDLTQALQMGAEEARKMPLFIAVDEEGGSISRVANKLGYDFQPAPGEMENEEQAFSAGNVIGAYLRPLGINLDFAPDADVITEEASGLGTRSFGKDAEKAAELASQMAQGLRGQGVVPCYKHFPGIGGTARDSHDGKAATSRPLEEMRKAELLPFQRAVAENIEMVMVSHITVRAIDTEYPSALSHTVITGLLRQEMGYDGVIVTDALRMRAVTTEFSQKQAILLSLQAGADMILLPQSLSSAVQTVQNAVASGEITEERIDESVERILALKITAGLIQ